MRSSFWTQRGLTRRWSFEGAVSAFDTFVVFKVGEDGCTFGLLLGEVDDEGRSAGRPASAAA